MSLLVQVVVGFLDSKRLKMFVKSNIPDGVGFFIQNVLI